MIQGFRSRKRAHGAFLATRILGPVAFEIFVAESARWRRISRPKPVGVVAVLAAEARSRRQVDDLEALDVTCVLA